MISGGERRRASAAAATRTTCSLRTSWAGPSRAARASSGEPIVAAAGVGRLVHAQRVVAVLSREWNTANALTFPAGTGDALTAPATGAGRLVHAEELVDL
jgi:hypothetical protein